MIKKCFNEGKEFHILESKERRKLKGTSQALTVISFIMIRKENSFLCFKNFLLTLSKSYKIR